MNGDNDNTTAKMIVSLTNPDGDSSLKAPKFVGGKSSSLAKLFATKGLSDAVPKAFALSVDFFQPWIVRMKSSSEFKSLMMHDKNDEEEALCGKLQKESRKLTLSGKQKDAIDFLVKEMQSKNWNEPKLAAVRSSAPEEDGTGASFAGAFETKLGIAATFEALEKAVHDCFASLWDYRVLDYKRKNSAHSLEQIGFAVVIMEMIDSEIAGVAFSANPLNSDRDEMVVDSSWGLGESVVDGSVTADRYIVDKLNSKIIEKSLGEKGVEKRLGEKGGVIERTISENDDRYKQSSLTVSQLQHLTKLVCLVEKTYGMPMDIEWAVIDSDSKDGWKMKLLQARPITTLFTLDESMMTEPGEKRKLYFDMHIFAGATTTNPFTTMDLEFISKAFNWVFEIPYDEMPLTGSSSDSLRFNSSTRQYINMSYALKFISPKKLSEETSVIDKYLSSIYASKDLLPTQYEGESPSKQCKYVADHLPSGWFTYVTKLVIPTLYTVMKGGGFGSKYRENPSKMKEYNIQVVEENMNRLKELKKERESNNGSSLEEYAKQLVSAIAPSFKEEIQCNIGNVIPTFKAMNEKRNDESLPQEVRDEYEKLCGGYIGDELMEINIKIYRLANALDESTWKQYSDDFENSGLLKLLDTIHKDCASLEGGATTTLPNEFLTLWNSFMDEYGFDGQDQLHVNCPRYEDTPLLLLKQLKNNAVGIVKDPSVTQQEQVADRRAVMKKQEQEAKEAEEEAAAAACSCWRSRLFKSSTATEQHLGSLSDVQKRNEILEHLMWIRNAPKIHLTKVVGMIRAETLIIQNKLIQEGRLEEKGDIFHLNFMEIDDALDPSNNTDFMEMIRPRKAVYERALKSTECPILVDSRCRILRPDPPTFADGEEPPKGTLIGAAMSPGVATGKVRIVNKPSETFENGEVLCAVVTGPAWTPLFASASAVVLQVGGVLQHGALCAREYSKPAVSSIDIHKVLKDGMIVSVDGNTGIVKILEED